MNISSRLDAYVSSEICGYIKDIAERAERRNQRAALVGGVVRDVILGRSVKEADVMVEPPVRPVLEEIAKNYGADLVSHERFLTFTLHFPSGPKLDVVTPREETYPTSAQLPVVKVSSFENDLARRDFTVNAMACLLTKKNWGEVMDPFFGEKDLQAKVIRILHPKSFEDDPTRIFRAARFSARYRFDLDSETESAVHSCVSHRTLELLSPVRRRNEFDLILKEENPGTVLTLLEKWGTLPFLHPLWTSLPLNVLSGLTHFSGKTDLQTLHVRRLALWLGAWGKENAHQMLTDLAYERDIKKQVTALL